MLYFPFKKIPEAKWRFGFILIFLQVCCFGKKIRKKKYWWQASPFDEKEKRKQHFWNKNVLTYLSWCISELNHHGKRWGTMYENNSIFVTISCRRILKTCSLLKSGRTRRWRRQGINILGPKDSSSLSFLHSHHKLFLFKLKSQIFKIGRLYFTYRHSDFFRGTNW